MENYCVYVHTNVVNKKRYVGITKRDPAERWGKDGSGYTKGRFANAIKKYGWSGFTHEILADCVTREEASYIEISLISTLRTMEPEDGYNMTAGGETLVGASNPFYGKKHTEKSREKMREAAKSRPAVSQKTREKLREANKGKKLTEEQRRALREARLNYVYTTEAKAKMRASALHRKKRVLSEEHKRRIAEAKKIPVLCVDTGVVFSSMQDAADAVGGTVPGICSVCCGAQKRHRSLRWAYANGR